MKFEQMPKELIPYCEFACMVCMAKQRMYKMNYIGCGERNIGKGYCMWLDEVVNKLLNEENNKGDIFTNWENIPSVKEFFSKSNEKKERLINLEGLK